MCVWMERGSAGGGGSRYVWKAAVNRLVTEELNDLITRLETGTHTLGGT